MSDLLHFFGNNDDEVVPKANNTYKCDNNNNNFAKKSAKRPNTLKANGIESEKNDIRRKRNVLVLTPGFRTDDRYQISPGVMLPIFTSLSCSNLMDLPNELPPENAKGNIEYKRQLLNLTPLRKQHLITQLKWRLEEGQGEAIYEIGVEDDGTVSGLEEEELSESVTNLCSMADTLNASVSMMRECNIGTRKALELLIKRLPTHYSAHETRIAVLGNMDAGKSTLIGVLTQGVLDDGQGKTRLSTFRHIHEVRSGRTSSISCQLLGFDAAHNVTNFYWQKKRLHQRGHEDIALTSTRLVSLIDLAGYWKYQHTTLFALTSRRPHYVLLVISASHVLKGTAIHHVQVSEALKLPIAIVITKTDRCSPDNAIKELRSWFQDRPVIRQINVVTSTYEAIQAAGSMHSDCLSSTIPVFLASCVTGDGIPAITSFLDALQTPTERQRRIQAPAEVWIDQMHSEVPRVDGCIVVGLVHNGSVYENDSMYLGPQQDGRFVPVSVHSIHRNRLQHTKAHNSQFASFAVTIAEDYPAKIENRENNPSFKWYSQSPGVCINDAEYPVQRGMVLLGQEPADTGDYFVKRCAATDEKCGGHVAWGVVVADIKVLDDNESLNTDLQKHPWSWIVHCGNVYQKCQIVIDDNLTNNDLIQSISTRKHIFRFNNFPQFIHCDDTFMFHRPHKSMKAHGTIKLLLGKYAFEMCRRGDELGESARDNTSPIVELNLEVGDLMLSRRKMDYWSDDQSSSDDDDGDDDGDEYVTAPSSPLLSSSPSSS